MLNLTTGTSSLPHPAPSNTCTHTCLHMLTCTRTHLFSHVSSSFKIHIKNRPHAPEMEICLKIHCRMGSSCTHFSRYVQTRKAPASKLLEQVLVEKKIPAQPWTSLLTPRDQMAAGRWQRDRNQKQASSLTPGPSRRAPPPGFPSSVNSFKKGCVIWTLSYEKNWE